MQGYYFITDAYLSFRGNIKDVKSAILAGTKFIQYRDKYATTKKLYQEALILRKLCKNVKFIINDRIDIALAVDADGVHIGESDIPYSVARKLLGKKKIIGISVHSLKEAQIAQKQGANYISLGPIFSTTTKKDKRKPVGVSLIRKIKKHITIPLVAIGGINLSNVKEVIDAGADAVCAISAVVTKVNIKEIIEKFNSLFKNRNC